MKILQQRLDSERRLLAEKMEREKAELGRAQSVIRAAAIGRKCVNSFLIGQRAPALGREDGAREGRARQDAVSC